MLHYAQVRHGGTLHLITGESAGTLHTACGRGLNSPVRAIRTYKEPKQLGEANLCISCTGAAAHFINVPSSENAGGIPVSSPRLGTGSRRY